MINVAEIYLIAETYTANDYGVLVPTTEERKIFARVTSVTSAEWFEGGRNGLNPEFRMLIFAPEYNEETVLRYKGNYYTIYRTYMTENGILELYVEKRKGNEIPEEPDENPTEPAGDDGEQDP